MSIADEFLQGTFPTQSDSETSGNAERTISSRWTSSAEATPASKTATRVAPPVPLRHLLAMSLSALLMNFARRLWYGRIPASSAQMPLGLGRDFDPILNTLAILSSPSDSGRVALGLTFNGIVCSCSPQFRSPNARDWKGMSAKSWRERTKGDPTPTLPDQIGGVPHPEFVEQLMGFPAGWTDLER